MDTQEEQAVTRGARRIQRRGATRASALCSLALACAGAGWSAAACAQSAADGAPAHMIVIPGNGESAETALANATRAAPAPTAAAWQGSGAAPGGDPSGAGIGAQPNPRVDAAWGRGARAPADPYAVRSVQAADGGGDANGSSATLPAGGPVRMTEAARPRATPWDATPAQAGAGGAPAGSHGFAQEDSETIRRTALAFLEQQSAGLPGKVTVAVQPAFARGLAACASIEPFLPTGARVWGRTMVGVRCVGERPWTIYLQARVSIQATYYVAARQIAPGEPLGAADLLARDGDLTVLPQAVITDPAQAVGALALARIGAGLPLRRDMLRSATAVIAGSTVRVVASGDGFSISTQGSVLSNAEPGQAVRVKTDSGQIITAVVKDAGTVEITL